MRRPQIVNLGSKENKESTWKNCFGIILSNKNVESTGFCYYRWRENHPKMVKSAFSRWK